MKNKYKNFIMIFFLSIFLTLTLLTLSITNKIYNLNTYQKLQNTNDNFNKNITTEKSLEIINFLKDKETLNRSFFTQDEISHMQDVKNIFNKINIIFLISLTLTTILIFYLIKTKQYKTLFYSSLTSLILSIFFILILTINPFNILFNLMHKILFPQGNYTFNQTSNLIKLFPIKFFKNFTKLIVTQFMIKEIIIFILIGIRILTKNIDSSITS